MESENEKVLFKAEFSPKLKTYLFFYVLIMLFTSIIGIVVVPFWILGLGTFMVRKYYSHLECVLTEKTLEFRKGYFFRIEKTVLLDKIQDLTLKEGPLLRYFGLTMLVIETAGQSNPESTGDAKLIGIKNAREFRKAVLDQRDKLNAGERFVTDQNKDAPANEPEVALLSEINETLKRIERNLQE